MRIIATGNPWFCLIFSLVLGGCAAPGPDPSASAAIVQSAEAGAKEARSTEAESTEAASTKTAARVKPPPGQEAASAAALPAPFRTRHAHFEPARFADLPGWNADQLDDAWSAFRQSCSVLHKRKGWTEPCDNAAGLNARDSDAIHRFFEREFNLYQIQDTNRTPAGVITGYYEPLLHGSRLRGFPYVFPVHASPDDMLYLSERSLKSARSSASIMARIEGRNVVPVAPTSTRARNTYLLDTGSAKPDIRTKLIRLRLDGNRIVPYYLRREIERDGLPNAKVLAWVSDRAALYSMQIQGSGKVRLPDGKLLRLAYAEQNGHPFRPALQALPMQENRKGKRQAIVTRGIGLPASDDGESMPIEGSEEALPSVADADTDAAPLTRAIPRTQAQRIDSSDVEKMIAALSARSPADAGPAAQQMLTKKQVEKQIEKQAEKQTEKQTAQPMQKKVQKQAAPASGPENVADSDQASVNTDPSYVFFREIPDDDGGPIGALGVQLTAGRSIAVDPRTTPLGFPVFVSTTYPGKRATLNRLMLAQDTGGAIRGAVRADYFWGFGQEAYALAARMKENGKMWLFFPKKQDIPASAGAIGLRGAATEQQLAECVVPDPELCVE